MMHGGALGGNVGTGGTAGVVLPGSKKLAFTIITMANPPHPPPMCSLWRKWGSGSGSDGKWVLDCSGWFSFHLRHPND